MQLQRCTTVLQWRLVLNLVFSASLEYFGNNWTADLVSVLNCINWCDLTEVSWDAHFKRLLVFDSTEFISIMKHF